ncbi:MAG: 50S ribosomal protein L29 [Gammaproteobacteria bacterium AqS3]|nr:50S ribosomal protein L29 [Gammaproteobacteria bacterium AqS3]
MSKRETKELRDLSSEELLGRILEWRQEQFRLRARRAVSGEDEAPHRHRILRVSIARAKTLLREREDKE